MSRARKQDCSGGCLSKLLRLVSPHPGRRPAPRHRQMRGACVFLLAMLVALTGAGNWTALAQSDGSEEVGPTHDELLQLLAPIALYPDALVAQILAGATYPTQIVEAARFVENNPNLSGNALVDAVNQQSWDPSVKALTQFPSVLDNMNQNLSWTSSLGDAYYNAPEEVFNAIQELRERAQAAGTLKTTSQQIVTTDSATQTIVIQPAQPTVVYVPAYNPTMVYGAPVATYPGYTSGEVLATAAISFGVGMLVGAAISNSYWGWNSWGCNWHSGNVVYQNNIFVSRSNVFAGGRGYWGGYRNPNYYRPGGNGNLNRPGWNGGYNRPSTLPANANRPVNVNRPVNINNVNRSNNANQINANRSNVNRTNNQQIASRKPVKSFPSPSGKGSNQNSQNFRGFGQPGGANRGAGAFGGFDAGGNARMAGNRGRSSLGGGDFGKGGGGFGAGPAGGGGLRGGRGGGPRR
jgi:hypothetical protein